MDLLLFKLHSSLIAWKSCWVSQKKEQHSCPCAQIYTLDFLPWYRAAAAWLRCGPTAKHKQFANICQHGVNKSGAGAARLVKRHELGPHDPRLFSELPISTFHQNMQPLQGQKMMPMIASASTELSVGLMTLWVACFLYSSSTSSSSPKSGWLQPDWTLYNGKVIGNNQSCLCYGLARIWCGLEFKPCDTSLHVTPAVSTKRLTYTWPPHPCLVFVKHSLSPFNFSAGVDPKANFTGGIFAKRIIPALRIEVRNENCT